jgi:hypothetical protein
MKFSDGDARAVRAFADEVGARSIAVFAQRVEVVP